MIPVDLSTAVPTQLVDALEPDALFDAVDALAQWTPEALAAVDHVLTHWVDRAQARPNDRDGLVELDRLIARIAARHSASQLRDQTNDFAERWTTFRDLLDARLISLDAAHPERIIERAYVRDILSAVAGPKDGITQARLREHLGLSESHASQILSVMASHGLITRLKRGRERVVMLTEMGRKYGGAQDAASAAKPLRHASHLRSAAA